MRIIKIDHSNVFKLSPVSARWLGETKSLMPVTPESGTKQIMEWLGDPTCAIFALVDDLADGFPYVGFLACHVHRYPFWKDKVVGEMGWYVVPEYRGQGLQLLKAMEQFGVDNDAKFMVMNIRLSAGGDGGARACAALEKVGFQEFERIYYRKI